MDELLQWWNLVYVLAFFFAMLYAVLNAMGLSGDDADLSFDGDADMDVDIGADVGGDIDFDADADVDMDVGADVDVDADMDADLDGGMDADAGLDAEAASTTGHMDFLNEALSFLGIGKVPLSVLIMTFLITFAVVGWGLNRALLPVLRTPGLFFPVSCAGAFFVGLTAMKLMAATLGRYLKPIETAAVSREALAGRIGKASLPVTETFGRALVHDKHGSTHKVVCRVPPGQDPIAKGQSVLLVRFMRERRGRRRYTGYYLVEPYEVPKS